MFVANCACVYVNSKKREGEEEERIMVLRRNVHADVEDNDGSDEIT